jgi:hypothetical protein
MHIYSINKPVIKGVPYAQEHDRGSSMDFVRAILLQKPVAKAEEHNREAHQQRDRHHIGCVRVSTDDQPIHLLLVRGKRVW